MLIYEVPDLSDADTITALYEEHLNAGDSVGDYVRAGLEDEGFVGVKCVDRETGRMVGILSARPGIEFTYPHPELEERIRSHWRTRNVYTIDMLIVAPAYQGLGIANEMIFRLREALSRKDADCVVLEEWIRADGQSVSAHKAYSHLGRAEVVARDPGFYSALADYGLTCPLCGVSCSCGAVISVIDLRHL